MTGAEIRQVKEILKSYDPQVYLGIKQWCRFTGQQINAFLENALTDYLIAQLKGFEK